jgi:hypothetical protein
MRRVACLLPFALLAAGPALAAPPSRNCRLPPFQASWPAAPPPARRPPAPIWPASPRWTARAELRSIIALNPDALAEAKAADARRRAGHALGPLDGVPILIKDNIETKDPATTAGSLALKDNITHRDAPVIALLRGAGAVILGKTNLSEWANIRSNHSLSGGARWAGAQPLCLRSHALRFVQRIGRGGGGQLCRRGAGHGNGRVGGVPPRSTGWWD